MNVSSLIYIFAARQRSCGEVMFSQLCLSVCSKRGLLCRALALTKPLCTGMQVPILFLDMFKFVSCHCTAPISWDMIKRVHYEADIWKGRGWHLTEMLSCLNTPMLYISFLITFPFCRIFKMVITNYKHSECSCVHLVMTFEFSLK